MRFTSVKFLTLVIAVVTLPGCSTLFVQTPPCKSHAYVRVGLADYISQRFDSGAPVRIGIIPFSVPANLSNFGGRTLSTGTDIAWRLHAQLLKRNETAIIEVFPREDWPGKQEEFFKGNFGAIAQAREAGYDMVVVGLVDGIRSLEEMTAHSKLIDLDNGITVWYGTSTATIEKPAMDSPLYTLGLSSARPDMVETNNLVDLLSICVANDIVNEDDITSEGLPSDDTVPAVRPNPSRVRR